MFFDTSFLKNDEISLIRERTADANEKRGWVPAYYFAVYDREGNKVGECDLRIGHNDNTYYGGNIGYTVFPPYRGKHYAAKACKLLFELARMHGMEYLYISCDPDNVASRKTCEYAGGEFVETAILPEENEMRKNGEIVKFIFRFVL